MRVSSAESHKDAADSTDCCLCSSHLRVCPEAADHQLQTDSHEFITHRYLAAFGSFGLSSAVDLQK